MSLKLSPTLCDTQGALPINDNQRRLMIVLKRDEAITVLLMILESNTNREITEDTADAISELLATMETSSENRKLVLSPTIISSPQTHNGDYQ